MQVDVDRESELALDARLTSAGLLDGKLTRHLKLLLGRLRSSTAELGVAAEDGVAHGRAGEEENRLDRHDEGD